MSQFYVKSVVNSATTITATFTTTSGTRRKSLILLEFDAIDQTTPLDQHALTDTAENGSGVFSTSNVTTTYAYEALAGLMRCNSVCSGVADVGTNYTSDKKTLRVRRSLNGVL